MHKQQQPIPPEPEKFDRCTGVELTQNLDLEFLAKDTTCSSPGFPLSRENLA
jgi:hypothetical protein